MVEDLVHEVFKACKALKVKQVSMAILEPRDPMASTAEMERPALLAKMDLKEIPGYQDQMARAGFRVILAPLVWLVTTEEMAVSPETLVRAHGVIKEIQEMPARKVKQQLLNCLYYGWVI